MAPLALGGGVKRKSVVDSEQCLHKIEFFLSLYCNEACRSFWLKILLFFQMQRELLSSHFQALYGMRVNHLSRLCYCGRK